VHAQFPGDRGGPRAHAAAPPAGLPPAHRGRALAGRAGRLRLRAGALTAVLALAAGVGGAQPSMPLSVDQQVVALLRILTFDRNFQHKIRNELVIGIVYAPAEPASLRARDEVVRTLTHELARMTIKQLPIRHVAIAYGGVSALEAAVRAHKVNVLYVTPGHQDNLDGILKISQTYGISSMTGVPEYVRRGVAVGMGKKQDQPEIIVNLANSRSEGMDLHPSLLRISTVVKTEERRPLGAEPAAKNRQNGKPK